MGLTCSCYDFCKGECDEWWEPGRNMCPPPDTKCCECGAPLSCDEEASTFCHMEVYEPEGEIPAEPEDDPNLSDAEYDRRIAAWDEFQSAHGWCCEDERYERAVSTDYRCDRCQGIADAIEELGYCLVPPGEVSEQHVDYVYEHSGVKMRWVRDNNGVLNPRRV